jgi:hypothetical protein
MRFVYPEFLWAFAALLIPVIIHLFNFRRYKTLYFSSLQFLKFVDQQTRATQKLKHYLILALRILALSALILAFAQPFIPVENTQGSGGKPVIAIYIDNSFSMTAKGTEGELISEARELARKVINDASLETGFLLHSNDLSGIEKRLLTKPEALEYLDKIESGAMVRQLDDVISWQRAVLDNENQTGKRIATRQHLLLSDFQKNSASLQNLKPDDVNYYYPIRFTPQENSNLYIDSIWFSSPLRRIGSNNELNIRLVNESDQDLTNVEVKFKLNSISRDIFMDIPADDNAVTVINYTEKDQGYKSGIITVNDRQLFWDDDYYFSYRVDAKSDVLILNGENAVPNVEQVFRLEAFYNVSILSENAFTLDALKNKELLVLNGLNDIPSGLADQLVSFAESGGSIALLPGKEINLRSYNSVLSSLNMPLFGSTSTQGTRIKKVVYDDPFFYGMFDKRKEELNLQAIKKSYTLNPSGTSRYFELIDLQNGQPLLIRSNNAFNCYVLTTSLDPDFGTFLSESLFPAILLRMGELSQRKGPIALMIGKDAFYPLFDAPQGEQPIHLKNKKIDFIPRIDKKGLTDYIVLNGIEAVEQLEAGTYDIIDESKTGMLSLNYQRMESSTELLTLSDVKTSLEAAGIKNVSTSEIDSGQSIAKIDIEKPFEYWRLFIILALVFLIAEMLVLKFWK